MRAIAAAIVTLCLIGQASQALAQQTPVQNQAQINGIPWTNGMGKITGAELQSLFTNINGTFGLYATAGANNSITSLSGLTTPLSYGQGGTSGSAGFVPGNIAVGASNNGLIDSGVQPAKNFSSINAPTVNSDVTQGFSVGSIWVQTPSGPMFYATSVAQGAAVWGQATPVAYHPYETKSWGFGNIAAGLTEYMAVSVIGTSQNFGNIAAKSGTLSTLYARTAASPGAGQTYTFTLYVGAIGAMSATAVTCQISGASATQCSDLVDTVAITAGQQWAVQLVTSASATGTSQSMTSLLVTY